MTNRTRWLGGGRRVPWLLLGWLLIWLAALQGQAAAAPSLTITPISWNVIGLDSNNPAVGPNRYPVGARVCNVGDVAATNIRANIFLDGGTTNQYISIYGLSTLTAASIAAGSGTASTRYQESAAPANCADFYFVVEVARNSGAYSSRVSDTATPAQRNTQLYHIDATADGLGTVSTPPGRELYVEKLISQGRNSISQFSGPTNVLVGGTYTYTLNATTAPGGYEQLEVFTNFPNNIFQITSVSTTYSSPTGGLNSTVYADACGWENNRTSTSYHNNLTCIGPANYSGAKAGDIISTRFTVKILSAGTAIVQSAINDFSGSSYHYNADFGDAINAVTITASNPVSGPDLLISKTHTAMSLGSTGTYTLSVSNGGGSPTSGTVTVTDTLPTGLNPTGTSGTVNGWTCTVKAATNNAQGSVSCTRSDALAAGVSYPNISIPVSVTATKSVTVTNTATVSGGNDANTSNNLASDPTTITASVDLGVTKTQTTPPAGTTAADGGAVAYTIAVSNNGSSADGAILTDPAVSGFTATSVTCSSSSNQSACPTSPTVAQLQNGVVIPTFAKNTTLTFIVTGTAAANSAYKITNTATISPATGFADANTADNIATATTTLQNPAPVAANDSASTTVNTAVSLTVTANDTDTAPGSVNVATVDLDLNTSGTQTSLAVSGKGTFTVNSGGVVTFTQVSGYSGTATASYTVQDNLGALSNTATITVTVNPAASPDTNTVNGNLASYMTKNSVITAVLGNDVGTGLVASGVVFPTQAAGTVTNGGKTLTNSQGTYTVNATGTVTLTPADGFSGAATAITYQVSDASGLTATSTLTVTVNAPPTAANDSASTLLNTAVTFNATANDTDVAPGTVNVTTVDLNPGAAGTQTSYTVSGKGTFTVASTGSVTFTPMSGYVGTVTATYTVQDNNSALSNPATLTVTVTNTAPTAVNDTATTPQDTNVTVRVTANDTDPEGNLNPATVDLDPGAAGVQTTYTVSGRGTFTVDGSGNVALDPVAGFSGTVAVSYVVQDTAGALSNAATLTITVQPRAVGDTTTVNGNLTAYTTKNSVTTAVLTNDAGTGLVASGVVFPTQAAGTVTNSGKTLTNSQGTYTIQTDGTVTFTPADGFSGTGAAVTYQVPDASGQTMTATLTVMVNAPPTAVNDSASTASNTAVTFSVTANDTDVSPGTVNAATVDLDPGAAGVQTTYTVSGRGTFTASSSGSVTFTPDSGFSGTVTATYAVRDNDGALSNPATITVQVTGPVGVADLGLVKVASAFAAPSTPADPAATPPVAAVLRTLTYTLTVTNSGTAATSGTVTVVDTLPPGLSATAVGGTGWTCTLSTLTCTRADALATGGNYEPIILTVRAPLTTELESNTSLREITNSASVSGGGDNTPFTATATTKMVYARLTKRVRNFTAGTAFGSASAGQPGQVLEYCLDFTNYGGAALSGFRVIDNVPGNTAAVTTGYDADEPGTATDFGMRLTRGATVGYLTSAVDPGVDQGSLSTGGGSFGSGVMEVILPTALAAGETGSACFKARIN